MQRPYASCAGKVDEVNTYDVFGRHNASKQVDREKFPDYKHALDTLYHKKAGLENRITTAEQQAEAMTDEQRDELQETWEEIRQAVRDLVEKLGST